MTTGFDPCGLLLYLGVTISKHLSCAEHIDTVSSCMQKLHASPTLQVPFSLNPWLQFQCLEPQHSTLYMKTRLNLYRILPQKLSWNSGTLTWMLKWDSWLCPKCPLTVNKRQKLSLSYRIVASEYIILPNDFMTHPCPHLPHKFHWERTSSLCKALFHQYKDVCNKQFG